MRLFSRGLESSSKTETSGGANRLSFTFPTNIIMQSSHSHTSSSSLSPTISDVSPVWDPLLSANGLIRQLFSWVCAMESTSSMRIRWDFANSL